MWFKNGLKAQKLLAQGIALGIEAINKSPCKGKSFINYLIFKAFALTGRLVCVRIYPGCYPGLGASAPSGREGVQPVIKVTVIKVIKDFGGQKYPSTSLYLIK